MSAPDIEHSRLTEVLSYDPDTGIFRWKMSRWQSRIGVEAGTVIRIKRSGLRYRHIEVDKNRVLAHRLAWFYVYGKWPLLTIDHVNGDGLDNRIDNLREATVAENNQNRASVRRNTSGRKGVHWAKARRKWVARIRSGGRLHLLGEFSELESAAAAYEAAAARLHGAFANHVVRAPTDKEMS